MSDAALRRTVRRGIALVVFPLASIAKGFDQTVWSDYYGAAPEGVFGSLAFDIVPTLLVCGSLAYLVGTGLYAAAEWVDPDAGSAGAGESTGETDESPTGSDA